MRCTRWNGIRRWFACSAATVPRPIRSETSVTVPRHGGATMPRMDPGARDHLSVWASAALAAIAFAGVVVVVTTSGPTLPALAATAPRQPPDQPVAARPPPEPPRRRPPPFSGRPDADVVRPRTGPRRPGEAVGLPERRHPDVLD